MRVQLNSILFAKTLVRKDVASSSGLSENKAKDKNDSDAASENSEKKDEEGDVSSKAQIMTLMTTDVDRVSEFAWHMFTLVGASRHNHSSRHLKQLPKTPRSRSLLARFFCTNYWARLLLLDSL